MKNIAKLLEKEQSLLDQIGKNREASRKLLTKNGQIRKELELVRKEIVDTVVEEMTTGNKSLYQVVKEALGQIDGRYNKTYDLINKDNSQ